MVTPGSLDRRKNLLEQFDIANRNRNQTNQGQRHDRQRQLAFDLVGSPKVRSALDLGREPIGLRESYGMTLFGQGALQARRLVEAGCKFVTVIWDEVGQLNAGWDTHVDHKNRLKNDLLPGFDAAFSALVLDLEQRGLLDETLIWVASEMGRTPKLENNGDGRGHWGRAYSNLLVGGGVIDQGSSMLLVQGLGRTTSLQQISNIQLAVNDGIPILLKDIADVTIGHEVRRGAVTADGMGEVVLGLGFMTMGENSHEVTWGMKNQLEKIKERLPGNVRVETVYDRTELVDFVIDTVRSNLGKPEF